MISLANALRTAAVTAGPAPLATDARAAMRQRLVAVATVQQQDAAVDRLRRRNNERASIRLQRRMAALAGSVAIFTGVAGVGVAAAHSLPGNPFYGVKRQTESVQLWLSHGKDAKGARHLEFARERLAEAKALPANSSHLASTLAAMDAQTTAGRNDLVAAYHSSDSSKPLAELATFTAQQTAGLLGLSKTVPATVKDAEANSFKLLVGVVTTVKSVSGTTCLSCLISGTSPTKSGQTPNGVVAPSRQPSSTTKSSQPKPAKSASPGSSPSTHSTSPGTTPTNSSKPILPLPSLSPLLHDLLGGKSAKTGKHSPTSAPSPLISTLLKGLGL
jgi:hypothetical protein